MDLTKEKVLEVIIKGDLGQLEKLCIKSEEHSQFSLTNDKEQNILHLAADAGSLVSVEWLIKHQSKLINTKDNLGWTPLHFASNNGHLNICHVLLQNGADPTIMNEGGNLAIHYLAKQDWYPRGSDRNIDQIQEKQDSIQNNDSNNNNNNSLSIPKSPLKRLSAKVPGTPEVMMKFLSKLKIIKESNNVTDLPQLVIEGMIEGGVDVNSTNKQGDTPVLLSCLMGYHENVKLLLYEGAYIFITNKFGESCFSLAEKRKNTELIELLTGFSNLFSAWIPDEILEHIFTFLSMKHLVKVAQVCKRFLHMINQNNKIWHLQYAQLIHNIDLPFDNSMNYHNLTIEHYSNRGKGYGRQNANWDAIFRRHFTEKAWNAFKTKNPDSQYDYLFKILVLGDNQIGRTSLITTFVEDEPRIEHPRAVEEMRVKTISLAGKTIKLQIWEMVVQERFRNNIGRSPYRGCHAILFCFDLTNRESWENISRWMMEADRYACENVTRVIVGLKSDLDQERVVSADEIEEYLDLCSLEYWVVYVETSSSTNKCVQNPFFAAAIEILLRLTDGNRGGPLENDMKEKRDSKCTVM